MAEISVQAVVLKRSNSGESDRRLTILTPELGKLDVIAKGARNSASRLSGSSEPLSLAAMNLAFGKRNYFVTQSQPITSFPGLRKDYDRLNMGLALVELYAAVVPFEQPEPELFELLCVSLANIERFLKPVVASVWAQAKLMEISGFMPQIDRCVITGIPVAEQNAWVSPSAGGYVCLAEAGGFLDRFEVRAEVLYGLVKIVDLSEPPANLRFAIETLSALHQLWRYIAEAPLPANAAILNELRSPL